MEVPEDLALQAENSHRGYWFTTHTIDINMAMTKERLINSGFYGSVKKFVSMGKNTSFLVRISI